MTLRNSFNLEVCPNCGDRVQKEVELFGRVRRVRIICSCKREERRQKEEKRLREEKVEKLKTLKRSSLMEESFYNKTFDNWDFKKGDEKFYNLGSKYAENFIEMKKEGLGLLIHGGVGNGKSYFSFAIANKLLEKGIPVMCLSINGILERIRESYSKWGTEGEGEIVSALSNADLLVIDDLGTEKITEWSLAMVYNIIDNRYRKKLPLIITTNLTLKDIRDRYSERVADRLNEMCTTFHHNGTSIRFTNSLERKEMLRRKLS